MTRIAVGVAALVLVSCGDDRGSALLAGEVSKASFEEAGLRWPLTVNRGRLGCDGTAAWFRTDDGTKYGLNGTANEARGYIAIEPIWAVDKKMMAEFEAAGTGEEIPIVRISVGDMIDEALKLCS